MLRRARSVFLIAFLIALPLSAAFNSTMQWDVRSNGNDVNGGGFDPGVASPGTDFSQQQFSQISYNDIIIGGTTTQGTSVAHPFDSTIPGNVINITAGTNCTVQRVEVLSVSGVTATFDKSLGTAASTCTGVLGGSLLVPITAINLMVTSNTVHIKSGTYTRTTTSLFNGTPNAPLYISGYGTTHGDHGTAPLLTTATNSIDLIQVQAGSNGVVAFDNISFSSTAVTPANGLKAETQATLQVSNSTFSGFNIAINGDNFGPGNSFLSVSLSNVEIKNSKSHGIFENGAVQLHNCWIHDNTGDGSVATSHIVVRSIISGNSIGLTGYSAGAAAQLGQLTLISSALVSNSSDGASVGNVGSANWSLNAINSIIYGNGGWGINLLLNTAQPPINQTNAYGTNTSGNRNHFTAGLNDITLTANPFISSTNFALNATAGGGAALKQTGFPGLFPGGTSTGYVDVGPVQTSGAPGTGGSFAGAFVQ